MQGSPCQIGAVHAFTPNPLTPLPSEIPTTAVFQPPTVNNDGNGFGIAVGAVPAVPALERPGFLLIGDPSSRSSAGEVYVYRRD